MGLLHVRMGGCGSRAVISTDGALDVPDVPALLAVLAVPLASVAPPFDASAAFSEVDDKREKKVFRFCDDAAVSENVNGLRANASWPVLLARGGSIGRNLKPSCCLQFSFKKPGRCTVTLR